MSSKIWIMVIALLQISCGGDSTGSSGERKQKRISSAEDFFISYTQLYQNGEFDQALECLDPECIFMVNQKKYSRDRICQMHQNLRAQVQAASLKLDDISTKQLGNGTALVCAQYTWNANMRHAPDQKIRGAQSSILKKKNGTWKILWHHETLNRCPLCFDSSLPKQQRTGRASLEQRFRNCLGQSYALLVSNLKIAKESGISVEEHARQIGRAFAESWNPQNGFEGLVQGVVYNTQALSTRPQILKRDQNHLTIRFYKDYLPLLEPYGITDQEVIQWLEIVNRSIANHMGASMTLHEEGHYIIQQFVRMQQI